MFLTLSWLTALPRIIYAMAEDGLLFDVFARVHERFKTPTLGVLIAGFLTGTLSAIFDVDQLVNMISIGTVKPKPPRPIWLKTFRLLLAGCLRDGSGLRFTSEIWSRLWRQHWWQQHSKLGQSMEFCGSESSNEILIKIRKDFDFLLHRFVHLVHTCCDADGSDNLWEHEGRRPRDNFPSRKSGLRNHHRYDIYSSSAKITSKTPVQRSIHTLVSRAFNSSQHLLAGSAWWNRMDSIFCVDGYWNSDLRFLRKTKQQDERTSSSHRNQRRWILKLHWNINKNKARTYQFQTGFCFYFHLLIILHLSLPRLLFGKDKMYHMLKYKSYDVLKRTTIFCSEVWWKAL